MLGLRMPELLIILVVLVLMFGAKKIPELGGALGKGIRAFRSASEKGISGDESSETQRTAQEAQPKLEENARAAIVARPSLVEKVRS